MAVNICRFAIRNAWHKPILKLLLAVLAILTTMRWLRQLMDYTKQRSFGIAAHGAIFVKWNLLPWSGLTGSTIADYWNQLEIFHRQNLKWHIIANWRSQLMQPDSNKKVSGKVGPIHPHTVELGNSFSRK